MNELHEAVIIGGGPGGLTAGIYLMRAGIDAVLLEKQMTGGAPLTTEHIENYPGFPEGITGRELMERMIDQAKRLGLVIKEFSAVKKVTKKEEKFIIETPSSVFEAKAVIMAMGTDPVKLGIPGEDRLVGKGISYCATCDAMFFQDLDVAVIGGGDAAIEEGLTLANMARRVYIVHRRKELRAQKILQDRAFKNERMEFVWNSVPIEIRGENQVESLLVKNVQSGELSELKVDGVFLYVGSQPDTKFLGDLVERDGAGFIISSNELTARTKGLFAVGDVRKKSLRQITTAVGDGALAAVNLEKFILERR
jgi:thioredoxin reductase (NADPH)